MPRPLTITDLASHEQVCEFIQAAEEDINPVDANADAIFALTRAVMYLAGRVDALVFHANLMTEHLAKPHGQRDS